jgi:hypothetical protein
VFGGGLQHDMPLKQIDTTDKEMDAGRMAVAADKQ